ncbi:rhomboid family protein [Calothrix sp. NIES-4101]|nr:rhomboid family protein [Calothrix sp. NIES-4101]
MIPIGDNVFLFAQRKPYVTYILIGITIGLFLWELKLELGNELGYTISKLGLIPAGITNALTAAISGNHAAWIAVIMSSTGILTGMFLHSSFAQILGNLLFLWVFGNTLEKIIGHRQFLLLYLTAGIFTALFQIFTEPNLNIPIIGANGAIASIIGAYIFKFPKVKIDSVLPLLIVFIPVQIPAFYYLFWWFIQQLFYGIGSLNIPPLGANQFSIGYWMQGIGMLFGAVYIRFIQSR